MTSVKEERVSPAVVKDLVDAGMTDAEIAENLGIDQKYVRNLRQYNKIKGNSPNKKTSDGRKISEKSAMLIEYVSKGFPDYLIAELLGLSVGVVTFRRRYYGVKLANKDAPHYRDMLAEIKRQSTNSRQSCEQSINAVTNKHKCGMTGIDDRWYPSVRNMLMCLVCDGQDVDDRYPELYVNNKRMNMVVLHAEYTRIMEKRDQRKEAQRAMIRPKYGVVDLGQTKE